MSLKLLADSHVDLIALDPEKWGETVTRSREDIGGVTTLTALVVWETAEDQRDKGRKQKQRGSIHVASNSTLSLSDRWLINGHYYATVAVGEPQNGMQVVTIAGAVKDMQTGSRGVI